MTNKVIPPSYEELKQAVLALDEAWQSFFAQACSNPVTNAWGKPIDFSRMNELREQVNGIVYAARYADKDVLPVVQKPTLQMYLENADEYSFKDLFLADLVEQEQRRQSKNEPEVESASVIQERLEDNDLGGIRLAVMIFLALQRAAKGEGQ